MIRIGRKKKFTAWFLAALAGMLCAAARPAVCEEPAQQEPFHVKHVEGTVVASTRYNLSIETAKKGGIVSEMVLPVDEKTQIRGYGRISDIRRGDTISAQYKQTYQTDDKGKEIVTGAMATDINLVRSASSGKLVSKEKAR
ncbi:MAG TPA: hypothetical protein VL688_10875 [Verrucomicrobiae bacterium]|jgi:hypothetical protein|nr:hypothetical protein [Verrucomicrobiae bacterium]